MNKEREAASLVEVIRIMNNFFGTALIEQITGATPAALVKWIEGGMVNVEQEGRLRTGYEVFGILAEADGDLVARNTMLGMNPFLDDRCFIDVIRQDRLREALAAARVQASGSAFG